MLKNIDLSRYVVQHPIKIRPDANLFDAVDLIVTHRISGLCVVDADDRLIGVLSEMDCLRGVVSATYNDSGVGSVAEFMTTRNLHVAKLSDNIVDIATEMLARKIRRQPVIDDDGRLIGQITIRQILRAVKAFAWSQERGASA